MGRELLQSNEVFKAMIRSLDQHLQGIAGDQPQYSIEAELRKPKQKSRLSSAELSQPLCTAVQIALVETLKALGIVPAAVVGHSSGEIAAAYSAGALTAGEAITAAHHRGAVTTKQKKKGAMAAIGMSWDEADEYLIPGVTIACDNSTKSVTISGDAEAVKSVVANIKKSKPDVLGRLLEVDKAYHSYHMAEIGEAYQSLIGQEVVGRAPSTPFFSSVTGKLMEDDRTIGSKYWQDNLESPVRFREAVIAILKHEIGRNAVLLEVGPHSALAGPLRQICTHASSNVPYVSVMTRNQHCLGSLLGAVGKLHSLNVPIGLESLFPVGSCLPDLPRYPWNHEDSYWYETRLSKEWRQRRYPYHDLLGVKLPESTELEPVWRNMFHLTNVPWVRDHRVGENVIFPFAGYIALAGEAVRQMTEVEDGFVVRNIIVSTALVLNDSRPTEIMASFRPYRLTDSLNSPWWEFSVASYNGHAWTKHCTGEVSALSSEPTPRSEPSSLPRKINAKKWYENMSKGGLDLGPCFQTLETIETSTNAENRATGKVKNGRQGDEDNYYIHPTVIDGTIQLLGAASVNGSARRTKNWLPTSIESFSIHRCSSNMVSSVSARLSSNQSVVGEGLCTSNGATVIEASGIKMSLADGALASDAANTHAAARCEWETDIDFLDVGDLIHAPANRADVLCLLEELGQLCLLSTKRRFTNAEATLPHLQKYLAWVADQSSAAVAILASKMKSLDNAAISARTQELLTNLSETPAASAATAMHHVCTKMDLLLAGETLVNILPSGTLQGLQDFIEQSDIAQFIRKLGHSKPNLRILDIGNGQSSPKGEVLGALKRADGQVLCSKYTFTSPGYISSRDQEHIFPRMEYLTLNISQDPFEQGFENRQYDLIIAANVMHATKNIQECLLNIKKLLHPEGRLLLQDLCPSSKWIDYTFGVQQTWRPNSTDGRAEEPYLSAHEWKSRIVANGFSRVEGMILDCKEPHQLTVTMAARPESFAKESMRQVTLLYDERGAVVEGILNQLEKKGFQVTMCRLNEVPPAGQDVISSLDAEKPFFDGINEAQFESFKTFLHGLQGGGLFWMTHLFELGCNNPYYAQILGLARVVRSEMLIDFATCQIDSLDKPKSIDDTLRVFSKFQGRREDEVLNCDFEWAISDNQIYISRFHPFALAEEVVVSDPGEKAILDVRTPGRVNSLHWVRQPREDLKVGEVEVQVHSAGLNFRVS